MKKPVHQTKWAFVLSTNYESELLAHISQATDRIVMASMVVNYGPVVGRIFAELTAAAKRQVRVELVFDVYTYFYRFIPSERKLLARLDTAIDELRKAGGVVRFEGRIGANPFAGRNHVKASVIDDTVFSYGGINLTNGSFGYRDYMLGVTDTKTADYMDRMLVEDKTDPKDEVFVIDESSKVLLDGGARNTSGIYDLACELTAQAAKVWYVSKLSPSGRLATLIKQGDSTCYFNRVGQASAPDNAALAIDKAAYNINNHYRGRTYIHAKFMLFEMQDGTKHLISGSNNFNFRGVQFGTREVALHSTDEQLWQELYQFVESLDKR